MIEVCSLGLFILDTFEFRSANTSSTAETTLLKRDEGVIGGGGNYAICGSRVWLPAPRVGILVDRGKDWNSEIQNKLDEFGKDMWTYREKEEETTKALNLYIGQHREFKYLTPRTRLEPIDLPTSFHSSQFLHFVCSPTRALVIQSQISQMSNWRPSLVYEPIPDRCVPEELESLRQVLPFISVFSPNHEEAWSFYGVKTDEVERRGKDGIEEVAKRFFEKEGANEIVVIRSGAWGAYCLKKGAERGFWVSAYYPYDDAQAQKNVVDVTGAGNSFLGGLMAGLVLHPSDLETAVQCASVAASFIIEQFGLPTLRTTADGQELWNESSPAQRLSDLKARSQLP
ncbi:hypothetical protein JCM5353_006629 [Sporobolomyces roseus]